MNLFQFEYFKKLADLKSFSRAAEALYVSQPNVSMQISALEKEWGIVLFKRGYRTVSLTPAGEIMYEAVKRCMADFENSLELARHTGNMPCTPVCVGVPEGCFLGNLTELLSAFQVEHPDAAVLLESVPVGQLVLPRSNGKYDMVVNQSIILQNKDELEIFHLADVRYAFVISGKHPLYRDNPDLTVADLNGQNLTLVRPASEDARRLEDHCKRICRANGFTPGKIIAASNVNSALLSAKMEGGVAMVDELVELPIMSNLRFLKTSDTTEMVIALRRDSEKKILRELAATICENISLDIS